MRMSLRSVPFASSLRSTSVPAGGGGPPPDDFPPAYATGLTTRWSADSLDSVLSDGAPVTSWATVMGASVSFTNGAKTAPIYKRGGVNNHSYVDFSTTAMGLLSGTVNVGSEFSMLIVATVETLLGGPQRTVQGNGNWLFGPYSNTWACFNGTQFSNSKPATNGQLISALMVSQGSYLFLWMNNVFYDSKSGSGTFGTALGLSGAGGFNEPWIGRMHEIIVYDAPDFGLASTVHPYLNAKYSAV